MDCQTFEALQKRVATLERQLRQVIAGFLLVAVGLTVGVVAQRAYSQGAIQSFAGVINKIEDPQTHVTCYVYGTGLSCVH